MCNLGVREHASLPSKQTAGAPILQPFPPERAGPRPVPIWTRTLWRHTVQRQLPTGKRGAGGRIGDVIHSVAWWLSGLPSLPSWRGQNWGITGLSGGAAEESTCCLWGGRPAEKGKNGNLIGLSSHISEVTTTPPQRRIYEGDGDKAGVLLWTFPSHESKWQGWKINIHPLPHMPTPSNGVDVSIEACVTQEWLFILGEGTVSQINPTPISQARPPNSNPVS